MATQNIIETIIPYARSIPVKLTAERLAPNRKHYIFINGIMCNSYINAATYDTGEITKVDLVTSGSGYNQATTKINFIGANTKTATATANVANGKIIGIDLTNRGAGYQPNVYITISGIGANANAVPLTSYISGTDLKTDKFGKVTFFMRIPNDDYAKFPIGTLIFVIADNPIDPNLATSKALCTFFSRGIKQQYSQQINNAGSSTGSNIKTVPKQTFNDDGAATNTQNPWYGYKVPNYYLPLTDTTKTTTTDSSPSGTVIPSGSVSFPKIDPITGKIYYTVEKNLGYLDIPVNASIKKNDALTGAQINSSTAKITPDNKLILNSAISLAGMPKYDGTTAIWDNKRDGFASFTYKIPIPTQYTLSTSELNNIALTLMNDKNGKDSLHKFTATVDNTTHELVIKGMVDETSDKTNQPYTLNLSLNLKPNVLTYPDYFYQTYEQTTTNGVPTGNPNPIAYGTAPVSSIGDNLINVSPSLSQDAITAKNVADLALSKFNSTLQSSINSKFRSSSGIDPTKVGVSAYELNLLQSAKDLNAVNAILADAAVLPSTKQTLSAELAKISAGVSAVASGQTNSPTVNNLSATNVETSVTTITAAVASDTSASTATKTNISSAATTAVKNASSTASAVLTEAVMLGSSDSFVGPPAPLAPTT